MARSRRRRSPQTRLTEATAYDAALGGTAIDSDDHLYRPLTGKRGDNLPAWSQEKAQALAKHLYRSNPAAHRFIGMLAEFILGEGVTWACKNPQVAEVIERHWRDPYNDWSRYGHDRLVNYLLFGELLMPLFPNAVDGHLRIGCALPEMIRAVTHDPENWSVVRQVTLKSEDASGEGKVYTVVNVRESRGELTATNPALFWSRLNPFGTRGLPVYYPVADFLGMLDDFMFSELERAMLLKAFVWDVSVDEATPEQLAKLTSDPAFQPPKPGSVRIHNSKVVWQAVNPQLDTYDATNGIKTLRNHIGGYFGVPEHWYAEGGDVNRASATAMSEVPRKALTKLQHEWRAVLTDVLQTAIDYAVAAGTLPEQVPVEREGELSDELIAARDAVEVILPDLAPEDNEQQVTTLNTLGQALTRDTQAGLISTETARKVYLTTAGTLGVEIDLDAELERIAAEEAERQAEEQRQAEQFAAQQQATARQAVDAANVTPLRRSAAGD